MTDPLPDPLAPILQSALQPTLDVLLRETREQTRFTLADFPMQPEAFARWRGEMIDTFACLLGLEQWRVRLDQPTDQPLAGRFTASHLKTIEHHGVTMEVAVIELDEPPLRVPVVICLPAADEKADGESQLPGVACSSGHSRAGLHDLVVNLDSYQAGMATRFAQAGFAAIAVEKIDAGYLSTNAPVGNDEPAVASHHLAWGRTTRAVQLKACLAACEMLAAHPRVDAARIGATGTSLGGWLSMETALLTDRIKAVADYGRKTIHLPHPPDAPYAGIGDYCHIEPGMLAQCDRNIHPLAYAPRPLLAGHGDADPGCPEQAPTFFHSLYERQYAALNASDYYEYRTHPGGDVTPPALLLEFFSRVLGDPPD